MAHRLEIEVVYAKADHQALVAVSLDEGATVEQAINASGLLQQFSEMDLASQQVGVFGQSRRLEDQLKNGDRVEIYRPLLQDPMEARRKRAVTG